MLGFAGAILPEVMGLGNWVDAQVSLKKEWDENVFDGV